MFNFFCNLAISIYYGSWLNISDSVFVNNAISVFKVFPIFNMFNQSTSNFYQTAGYVSVGVGSIQIPQLALTIAVILSTICCIGVFFMIVKSVKKLFNVFLGE